MPQVAGAGRCTQILRIPTSLRCQAGQGLGVWLQLWGCRSLEDCGLDLVKAVKLFAALRSTWSRLVGSGPGAIPKWPGLGGQGEEKLWDQVEFPQWACLAAGEVCVEIEAPCLCLTSALKIKSQNVRMTPTSEA